MFQMTVEIGLNDAFEQYVGSFGRYQKIATLSTSLTAAMSVMSMIDITFLTAAPSFWFVYDGEVLNETLMQMRIDVCKLENGTAIDELGAGHWQYRVDEYRSSVVSRVNDNLCRMTVIKMTSQWAPWASYQIRKIAGCANVGNAGNVFSATAD